MNTNHCLSRQELWRKNNYTSRSVSLDEDDSDEGEGDEGVEYEDIRYVSGNVTQPLCTEPGDAVIVHCVGTLYNRSIYTCIYMYIDLGIYL